LLAIAIAAASIAFGQATCFLQFIYCLLKKRAKGNRSSVVTDEKKSLLLIK